MANSGNLIRVCLLAILIFNTFSSLNVPASVCQDWVGRLLLLFRLAVHMLWESQLYWWRSQLPVEVPDLWRQLGCWDICRRQREWVWAEFYIVPTHSCVCCVLFVVCEQARKICSVTISDPLQTPLRRILSIASRWRKQLSGRRETRTCCFLWCRNLSGPIAMRQDSTQLDSPSIRFESWFFSELVQQNVQMFFVAMGHKKMQKKVNTVVRLKRKFNQERLIYKLKSSLPVYQWSFRLLPLMLNNRIHTTDKTSEQMYYWQNETFIIWQRSNNFVLISHPTGPTWGKIKHCTLSLLNDPKWWHLTPRKRFIALNEIDSLPRHQKGVWGGPSSGQTQPWRTARSTSTTGMWLSFTVWNLETMWSSRPPWNPTWIQSSFSLSSPKPRVRSSKDSLPFDPL